MSAAEKLRALAETGFTCEHWTDVDASDLDVTDELIAVVEAAERWPRWCPRCGGSGIEPESGDPDDSPNPWTKVTCDECGDTRAALIALDEALGGVT